SVPGELAQRLGKLLQPADIGESAIPDRGIGAEDDIDMVCFARRGGRNIDRLRAHRDWLAGSATKPWCRDWRHRPSKSLPNASPQVDRTGLSGAGSMAPSSIATNCCAVRPL